MITPIEKVLYTARAHTVGGREGGTSETSDGQLKVKLAVPGTKQMGTNPEQLFAAGWSACFLSSLKLLAGKMKVPLPPDISVDAEVDLGLANGAHLIQARLNVRLPGVPAEIAQKLVDAAHQSTCPYSKATQGNINVVTNIDTGAVTEEAGAQP
jgi:Ohr subfamily peroxiredoxin